MIIIGHRGAAGYAPENTIVAVRRGIELKADFVEIDIQATRDGKLVAFHDKLLDRVTNATGYLADYGYSELSETVRVRGSERIPLVGEVCEVLRGTGVGLFAEILTLGLEVPLLAEVLNILEIDQLMVASFHHRSLVKIRELEPAVETVALLEGLPIDLRRVAADSRCKYLGLGFESMDSEEIQSLIEDGIRVIGWTVNDRREMESAAAMGLPGIVSDYPDLARSVLGSRDER